MNTGTVTSLVFSAISLYGLWLLWTWLYRDYRIDLFRDRMFILRQELFDLAAQGATTFDHPAYGTLRTTMNGFIRLADDLNLTTLLITAVWTRDHRPQDVGLEEFPTRWKRETTELDPEVRDRMNRIVDRMHLIVADQLIFTSSLLTITVVPVIAWMIVKLMESTAKSATQRTAKYLFSGLGRWMRIEGIDSTAHAVGSMA